MVDLIITNAVIHTMNPDRSPVSAMAIARGEVIAIGGDLDVLELASEHTRVLDLNGAPVLPGLIDSHNHHRIAGEEELFRIGFSPAAGLEQICLAVEEWIKAHELSPGDWVLGGNWGSTLVPLFETTHPLALLDAVSPQHPVVLSDDSHHNSWANSAALAAAGIDDSTPDPVGGRIVRDSLGHATGLLLESAGAQLEKARLAHEGIDVHRVALSSERGIQLLHEFGITAFQDASATRELLEALAMLDDQGRLKSWVVTSLLINDTIFGNDFVGKDLIAVGSGYRTERHHPVFTKIFLDGVPPTRTAAFLEPYLPTHDRDPAHRGVTTMSIDELEGWLRHAAAADLGVKVHCTGDASVRMVLDVVERVRNDGITTVVHVSHGQYVHRDDISRFAELDVIAEISPFLWYPGVIPDALAQVIPQELGDRIHPNRELLDAGATVVAGSDWPVSESPNPWHAIFGLVTRRDPTSQFPGALAPDQAITVYEAIQAFTTSSARALRLGDTTGHLAPGMSADFVVLSADPFDIEREQLKDIVTEQTWFRGEQVYHRP